MSVPRVRPCRIVHTVNSDLVVHAVEPVSVLLSNPREAHLLGSHSRHGRAPGHRHSGRPPSVHSVDISQRYEDPLMRQIQTVVHGFRDAI